MADESSTDLLAVQIHGVIYDVSNFDHPGGAAWLSMVGGMDATTHFEMHHLRIERARRALRLLPKLSESKATIRELADNTWDWSENGFYATLRSRTADFLLDQAGHPTLTQSHIATAPLEVWRAATGSTMAMRATRLFAIALYASFFIATCFLRSRVSAVACGIMTAVMGGFGHNALHQRGRSWDCWLMDLSSFSHEEFRRSHVGMHHAFPNLSNDTDVDSLPFVTLGPPRALSGMRRVLSVLIFHVVIGVMVELLMVKNMLRAAIYPTATNFAYLSSVLAPLLSLIALFVSRGTKAEGLASESGGFLEPLLLWIILWSSAGTYFLLVTTPSHNQESNWRAAMDGPKTDGPYDDPDWGSWQIATATDIDVPFGLRGVPICGMMFIFLHEQTLHHLFPTLDHSRLHALRPLVSRTAEEFGVELREPQSYWSLYIGLLRTVAGLSTPTATPSKAHKD